MKIGIVTVYESIDNLGSYLQTYALKSVLEELGHDVAVIQNVPTATKAKKYIFRLNPKREFFLRIQKFLQFLQDNKKLNLVPKQKIRSEQFDLLVYGSDEIWNLENPYFRNPLFWGETASGVKQISYAASVGALTEETLNQYVHFTESLKGFRSILVRDEKTATFAEKLLGARPNIVCDPTMLISLNKLSKPIEKQRDKYLLVYTYGIPEGIKNVVVQYARQHHLKIISLCFWHPWADKVVIASPLQFSAWIEQAACVFTTTFHGAVFTMLNHKQCCIYPMRDKVADIVKKMGAERHLIAENCNLNLFSDTMNLPFNTEAYEKRLCEWREFSMEKLKEALL